MFSKDSRYANQPVLEHTRTDGVTLRYVLPRWVPSPDSFTIGLRHRATDSERIDHLAYRHLGAPTAWWLIADANLVPHPADLPGAPGNEVLIPIPGIGGGQG
jgi:hypothetical protein